MKTCPSCGAAYADDLSYCLADGMRLSATTTADLTNRPTEILSPNTIKDSDISTAETIVSNPIPVPSATSPPPPQFQMSAVEPASRMGCVVTIGKVAAGLLVVVGLGVVGLVYTLRRSYDVARLEAPAPKLNSNANTGAPDTGFTSSANVAANSSDPKSTPALTGVPKMTPGGLLNDKAISLPKPVYPPAARAVRASGTVTVQVLIDQKGDVISATAQSGHPLLRKAAEAAAIAAKFSPTLISGQPVTVSGVISYNFVPQ